MKSGQLERAINDLEEAVRLQDGLRYSEPPDLVLSGPRIVRAGTVDV
jgi:hypothetical protein